LLVKVLGLLGPAVDTADGVLVLAGVAVAVLAAPPADCRLVFGLVTGGG
jgi:hypothetical protein